MHIAAFTNIHKEKWKENLAVHQKSLGAKLHVDFIGCSSDTLFSTICKINVQFKYQKY